MEMDKKITSGMQEMSAEDLEAVTGGETRRIVQKSVCPICGEEITVPLSVHMKGHNLAPCPVCGTMMPAGKGSKCYHCGYTASNKKDTDPRAEGETQTAGRTIFLDSKC